MLSWTAQILLPPWTEALISTAVLSPEHALTEAGCPIQDQAPIPRQPASSNGQQGVVLGDGSGGSEGQLSCPILGQFWNTFPPPELPVEMANFSFLIDSVLLLLTGVDLKTPP